MADLMQLGEILRDIPEQELRQATNGFEENVNRLLAALPVNQGTKSIAALYCGLAGTGLMIHDRLSEAGYRIRTVCEEQRKLYCDIVRIRMFCHGIENPCV